MKVFVTGAGGFIGGLACAHLIENGVAVHGLRRAQKPSPYLSNAHHKEIAWYEGDVCDKSLLSEAMRSCDAVFHIAALFRSARFPPEEYWRVNVEGTRTVCDVAQSLSVKSVIHCSTTGVLGTVPSIPSDERAPYSPLDLYQRTKVEAETLALSYYSRNAFHGCVIRPAMVWGPHDTRLLKLYKGVASRRLPLFGSGNTWCHWVNGRDVARSFLLATNSPQAHGNIYTIGGESPISIRTTMELLATAFHTTLLPFRIPLLPVQLLGDIVEKIYIPLGKEPPLHRRRVDFFAKDRCFDCSAATRDLGYSPAMSLVDDIIVTCRWYVDNHVISLSKTARDYLFGATVKNDLMTIFSNRPEQHALSSRRSLVHG
jgi:dihydroflavonol-4-reductase